ncbi:hypothetical protein TL16_g08234 [Triparma laevis f. inornata]|uniref:Uncharacterized protein n=2 Tax=Triparma laevis TaxID=1534972 RepID=A0A9W7C6V4_9STRA|nr:hypothetical protein TL16_g08234 [Triparma laevis f. inornata]GMI01087.1 hypothetical protein TrLO_g498 [Triparma laevis f. longispina]
MPRLLGSYPMVYLQVRTYCVSDGSEIVQAPFFGTGGISTAISASATNLSKQITFDFFNYVSAPSQANEDMASSSTLSDPFRENQLNVDTGADLIKTNGWLGDEDIAAYFDVNFWAQNNKNAAVDLRIPGATSYFAKLEEAVDAYVYNSTTASVMTEDEFVEQVTAAWNLVPLEVFPSSDAAAAKNGLHDMYRRSLTLPLILVDADLVDGFVPIDSTTVFLGVGVVMADVATNFISCINVLNDNDVRSYHEAYLGISIVDSLKCLKRLTLKGCRRVQEQKKEEVFFKEINVLVIIHDVLQP